MWSDSIYDWLMFLLCAGGGPAPSLPGAVGEGTKVNCQLP